MCNDRLTPLYTLQIESTDRQSRSFRRIDWLIDGRRWRWSRRWFHVGQTRTNLLLDTFGPSLPLEGPWSSVGGPLTLVDLRRPWNRAHRKEAAFAVFQARLWQVPFVAVARRSFLLVLFPVRPGVGGGGGVPQWSPALNLVELGKVRMEVDPHQGIVQLRVLVQQVAVSVNKRTQHLLDGVPRRRLVGFLKYGNCSSITLGREESSLRQLNSSIAASSN